VGEPGLVALPGVLPLLKQVGLARMVHTRAVVIDIGISSRVMDGQWSLPVGLSALFGLGMTTEEAQRSLSYVATGLYTSAALPLAGVPVPANLITAEKVTNGKPHPEPYMLGASILSVTPQDCESYRISGVQDSDEIASRHRRGGCAVRDQGRRRCGQSGVGCVHESHETAAGRAWSDLDRGRSSRVSGTLVRERACGPGC
jgi:hypothetical protein